MCIEFTNVCKRCQINKISFVDPHLAWTIGFYHRWLFGEWDGGKSKSVHLDPDYVSAEILLRDLRSLLEVAVAFRDQAKKEDRKTVSSDDINGLIERCRQLNNETVELNGGNPNWLIDEGYFRN